MFVLSGRAGARLNPIDAVQHLFFDIQTLRSGHVARARYLPVIPVSGLYPGRDRTQEFEGQIDVHLLVHVSGFVCLRPTIRFDQFYPRPPDTWLLHYLERGPWDIREALKFRVPEADTPLVGNMRTLMNWVFLDLITRWAEIPSDAESLAEWAAEHSLGCERLHQLAKQGLIDFPFPVTFGTQFEVAAARLSRLATRKADDLAAHLAHEILRTKQSKSDVPPLDIEHDAQRIWWYVEESQALTLTGQSTIDPVLGVIDPDRTQLLEYLTIRRGALRSVQRETQTILSEGTRISKSRIEMWYQIVETTTDDYVLNDRIGQLIKLLRRHNVEERRLRDLALLEEQVRGNLESFERRLEATGAWITSVVGALVGAGALVIGLNSVTLSVLSSLLKVPVDEVPSRYGAALSAVTITLLGLSFLATYALIRRTSASLEMRLKGRRRPLRKSLRLLRAPGRVR